MTMQDPVSDMLTRIRNSQAVDKSFVDMPKSNLKMAIAKVLKDEGYITSFSLVDSQKHPTMRIELKYYNGKPVIDSLTRESKPSLRKYTGSNNLPKVKDGLGVAIISTSKGVMSGREARRLGLGGEVLVYVS
jgi:small subunit ribosomal protein S8